MRRPVAELVVAVVASALIGFGLQTWLADLHWATAIGTGLLLTAMVGFALPMIARSVPVKAVVAVVGFLLVLLPSLQV